MCDFKTCDDSDLVKRFDKELAQVLSATPATNAAVRFRATNPSKKLHLTLHAYARPGNNGAGISPSAHVYAGETWQLTAAIFDNPETELNVAFVDSVGTATPRPLPDSWDIADGVKIVHGVLNILGNTQPTGDIYKVVAIWEPIDPTMSMAERLYWFKKCELTAESNKLTTIANGNT